MFEGFETVDVDVDGVRIHARGGRRRAAGAAAARLSRDPRASGTRCAPRWPRASRWSPPTCAATATATSRDRRRDHAPYSKRAMAADQVGGDARAGHRALRAGRPRPRRPGGAPAWRSTTPRRVSGWPSSTSSRPGDVFADVDRSWRWPTSTGSSWPSRTPCPRAHRRCRRALAAQQARPVVRAGRARSPQEAVARIRPLLRRPASIHATCEDYRAGATIDLDHDEAAWGTGQRVDLPGRWSCGGPRGWSAGATTCSASGGSGPRTCRATRCRAATSYLRRPRTRPR